MTRTDKKTGKLQNKGGKKLRNNYQNVRKTETENFTF